MMKLDKIFNVAVKIMFSLFFTWIFILLLFFSDIKYESKRNFLVNNVVIIIFLCLIIAGIFLFKKRKNCFDKNKLKKFLKNKKLGFNKIKLKKLFKNKKIDFDKIVKILTLIIFPIQIYVFYHAFFETGWDSGGEIIPAAKSIMAGGSMDLLYFSNYPNNLLLVTFYTAVLRLNSLIGIFNNDFELMSIVVINCMISIYTCYMIYIVGKRLLKNKKVAFIGYIFSIFLLAFSPWNIICYSDALALGFSITMLALYTSDKLKFYKYPLIFVLGYIAFSIKPQSVLILFAILLVEFIKLVKNFEAKKLKKCMIIFAVSITLVLGISKGLNAIYIREGFDLNPELKFGMSHFLMMGSNEKTTGIWNAKDVIFSQEIKTSKERVNKNIEVYIKRVKKYGAVGYFKFLSRKLLLNYNDGTFAWGGEGAFYFKMKPEISRISKLFRNIYYEYNESGNYFMFFSTVMQILWITVLLIIFMSSIFNLVKKEKLDYTYMVLILTVVFLTIFELLFEARARYLYTNIPIYILLMMYGIKNMFYGGTNNEK